MSRAVRTGMGVALAVLLLAGAASALTVTVLPTSAGLDQGYGYLCTPDCTTQTYALSAPAAATGSISFASNLALATDTVTVSLAVPISLFLQTPAGPDTVTFTAMVYGGTLSASVIPLGGGSVLVGQDAGAVGAVFGSYVATAGGSGPIALASVDVNSFTCVLDATNSGTCGVSFGITAFPVNVGGGPMYFQHTFNLLVPEPTALVLLGVAALGLVGRRRIAS